MRAAAPVLAAGLLLVLASGAAAQRARDLGVPFDGQPGALDAITDVAGVRIGHSTIVEGDSVRTGVTAVWPDSSLEAVFAASFVLNGNGEATGLELIDEWGYLLSPVVLTNTISVGTARDAVVRWSRERTDLAQTVNLPVVAETWDGLLNDIYGFHVTEAHVRAALDSARTGPVAEGNVGGGTGMVCHGFKGGIGTASRITPAPGPSWTVGVLVQANYGARDDLRVAGVPVGRHIPDLMPELHRTDTPPADGSIIVVVATDAPLLPHQLERVARRAPLGLARCGSHVSTHSGDIVIAFSTQRPGEAGPGGVRRASFLAESALDPVFEATVQATEEAIVNALVAASTMVGRSGNRVHALPHDRLRELLRDHGRLD